jgi:integrase
VPVRGPDDLREPDGRRGAEAWLIAEHRLADRDDWTPPAMRAAARRAAPTLREYAPGAMSRRRVRGEPLRPRTLKLYDGLLERVLYPAFGDRQLRTIRAAEVGAWHSAMDPGNPTQRAHAYALLRPVFEQAKEEGVLAGDNPCRIRGAGVSRREREIEPLSIPQLEVLVTATPERLRAAVLIAAWCGLRFGEIFELRRGDVDLAAAVIHVRRAVVRVDRVEVIGRPKSDAGVRKVAVPPHVVPTLQVHLDRHVGASRNALLFATLSGAHWTHGNFYKAAWIPARTEAGVPTLRFHDLRHTSAVPAAQTGATIAELMARPGHSTSVAALRYQHAAQGRDAAIAEALSGLAATQLAPVIPFRS